MADSTIPQLALEFNVSSKACAKCHATKPLTDFHKDSTRRDGRDAYCKKCKALSRFPDGKKVCARCRGAKPLSDYTITGKGHYTAYCRPCGAQKRSEQRTAKARRDGEGDWARANMSADKVESLRLKDRTYYNKRRKEAREKGLCSYCCVHPRSNGKACQRCYERDIVTSRPRAILRVAPHREYAAPCVVCGFELSDVHHINRNHKDNRPENLISLCPNHHRLVHRRLFDLTPYLHLTAAGGVK